MIKDNLYNAKTYCNLSDDIKCAFEWLENNDLKNLEDGKYEISNNIYANIQSYETKDEGLLEAHRKYLDIQYMICGKEKIGVANYTECNPYIKYDSEKDIEFVNCDSFEKFGLKEGEFFIFYPQDAHMPCLKWDNKEFVKKIVVKIKL